MTDETHRRRQRPPAFPQHVMDAVKSAPPVARGREATGRAQSRIERLRTMSALVLDASSLIAAGRAHEARPVLDAVAEGLNTLANEIDMGLSDISDTPSP